MNEQRNNTLLVTERVAARMLGVCQRTVFTLRKAGEIPFVKIGRSVRYSAADLKALIERRRVRHGNHCQ